MDDFATGYMAGQDSGSGCGGGGFGGFGEGIWAVIILAILFGRGGFGGFGGGDGGDATRAAVSEGFALNGLDNGIRGVQQGLCDGFYAMNTGMLQGFDSTNVAMMQGFNGVDRGFCNLGAQLADCCCQNREAIAQVRYDMATQACDTRNTIQTATRDLIENQNANARQIMDFMVNSKIEALQAENQALRFSASQDRQNAYLTTFITAQNQQLKNEIAPAPIPSYDVPAPYPYCVGTKNTGCGCY